MYQQDTEKIINNIENSFRQLKFDNKRLINNPLSRNREECFEAVKEMRKWLFKYNKYLKGMILKYDYSNRGQRL